MPSPSSGLTAQPTVLEQWRAAGGERLTYSEVAWTGTSVALVGVAALGAVHLVTDLFRRPDVA